MLRSLMLYIVLIITKTHWMSNRNQGIKLQMNRTMSFGLELQNVLMGEIGK